MKKASKLIVTGIALLAVCTTVIGCTKTDKKYFENVSKYSFWDNAGSESIAQYKYYNIMDEYLKDGVIANGNVTKDGKVKKVAFIGWDGARAEALSNILLDTNSADTNHGIAAPEFSGLNTLKAGGGGVYLAYCGGEKGKDSEQDTSTSASWTSEFTGAWSKHHGVASNDHVKNMEYKTIFLQYAEKGLQTGLGFAWGDYFDIALKEEVKYMMAHPDIPFSLKDIDRKPAATEAEAKANENKKKSEKLTAENMELYNAVANRNISANSPYDSATRDYVLDRINEGDDIVGAIFDTPDHSGHSLGFTNDNSAYVNAIRNCDEYLLQIINAIKIREQTMNEEWLIIAANDHGGSGTGHGKQVYEHRTNWVASNKPINSKYFGNGYNGFKEN